MSTSRPTCWTTRAHPNGQRGYLFHNNRNGTFTDVTDSAGIAGEAQSHSATWWDYDNDGWPDLYVANDYGAPDKLYHNNRDGTFTDVTRPGPAAHARSTRWAPTSGDVNNDGLIDLLVADMAATTHQKDQNSIAESRERDGEADSSPAAQKLHRSALFLNTGHGPVPRGRLPRRHRRRRTGRGRCASRTWTTTAAWTSS